MSQLFSLGTIARRTGRAIHQVRYVIAAKGIESVGRVGNAHAYDEAAVLRIEQELAGVQQRQEQRRRPTEPAGV